MPAIIFCIWASWGSMTWKACPGARSLGSGGGFFAHAPVNS
jgi:hypothetical protein